MGNIFGDHSVSLARQATQNANLFALQKENRHEEVCFLFENEEVHRESEGSYDSPKRQESSVEVQRLNN